MPPEEFRWENVNKQKNNIIDQFKNQQIQEVKKLKKKIDEDKNKVIKVKLERQNNNALDENEKKIIREERKTAVEVLIALQCRLNSLPRGKA